MFMVDVEKLPIPVRTVTAIPSSRRFSRSAWPSPRTPNFEAVYATSRSPLLSRPELDPVRMIFACLPRRRFGSSFWMQQIAAVRFTATMLCVSAAGTPSNA